MKHLITLTLALLLLSGCSATLHQANAPSTIYLQTYHLYLDQFPLDPSQIRLSITLQFNNTSDTLEKWTVPQIILYVDQKTYFLNEITIQNAEFPFDHWDGTLLPYENKKITLFASVPAPSGTYATAEILLKCQDRTITLKTPEILLSYVY